VKTLDGFAFRYLVSFMFSVLLFWLPTHYRHGWPISGGGPKITT